MPYKSTSIQDPSNSPDNILNRWILITADLSYNDWIAAYLHGGVKYPPKHDSCAGSLFYVESVQGRFAVGRFVETLLSPQAMDLSSIEFELVSNSMVEPFLEAVLQRIKTQQSAPLDMFPQVFKDYANAKVTNETIEPFSSS
jgi:hypothetical protein